MIAAISNYYLLVVVEYKHHFIAWPILMSLGGIISGIISYRRGKTKTHKTYLETAMSNMWFSIFMVLLITLIGMKEIGPEAAYPIVLALYGLGTFASGRIMQFIPLQIGGISAWVCALIAFHVSFPDQLILFMVAILLSYIIPGHLLASLKKENV